jgi:hypothetical protein
MAAHYSEWGGLGDDLNVAGKVEAITLSFRPTDGDMIEDIAVELRAQDFELSRTREQDVALVRMVGGILALATEEPTDQDLMPLTDAHIDMYREKVRKLCEEQNRAEAERVAAAQPKLAAPVVVPKTESYSQPDFTEEETPLAPPLAEDPDIAANRSVTAYASATTVEEPKKPREETEDAPVATDAETVSNGYSVESFVSDNDLRELDTWQRNLIVQLCLAIDKEKIPSYRRGFHRDPNTSRFITPYMVRTVLDSLPAGSEARNIELFMTAHAKKQTALKHPDWFDPDTPLPAGFPTLYWVEEVGDRISVGTTASVIPNFPADRFRSPGDVPYLMNTVRSEILEQIPELFGWTSQSGKKFSQAVRRVVTKRP